MKKRILGVFMTLAMILSLLPVTALAVDPPSESDAAAMTLSEFVAAVTENDGVYDGQGAVVTITPASGCRLTHSGHPEIVDGQTPERIQFYDQTAYAQYQRFKGLRDLNISNVTFKLVPPETDIVFCGAWNTTQVTVSPDKLDAELQTENTGSVTFTNCVFEHVAVSPIASTSAVTFTGCSFSGLSGYAVKDVKASAVSVVECSFSDCSGGVYMNGGGTDTTTYTGNDFTDIGTRGAIQFGNSGNYTGTEFSITGNTFTAKSGDKSGFLRQLNDTISRDKITEAIADNTIPDGMGFTEDSKTASFELPEGCSFPAGTTVFDGTNYYATMKEALDGIHQTENHTLWCKPGADVGTLTHGHVCSDLTVYGNGAYISAGERDFELDTYAHTCAGITADISLTIYNLDGAAVWGQRTTSHTLNIYLEGCRNMNRVYISGAAGTNNITLKNCTFDRTQAEAGKKSNTCTVYSNAAGAILVDGCTFTGVNEPINLNNKAAAGTQDITVRSCIFTDCSTTDIAAAVNDATWAAPIRVLSSEGAVSNLTVESCGFSYTDGKESCNGDILLGDGRTGKTSYPVYATISDTAAEVQIQAPGDRTESANNADKVQVTAGEQAALSNVKASIGDVNYTTLDAALAAAQPGDTIILQADAEAGAAITVPAGVTLDGNGKSISCTADIPNGAFVNAGGNGVTIQNVTINTNGYAKHGVQFYCVDGGKLSGVTINGGRYTSVIINGSTNIVLENCTLNPDDGAYANVEYGMGSGVTTIPSVTVSNVTGDSDKALLYVDQATLDRIKDVLGDGADDQDATDKVKDTVTNNGSTDITIDVPGSTDITVEAPHQGGSSTSYYTITVEQSVGGSVKTTPAMTTKGSTVTITVTADEGYVLSSLSITDQDGKALDVTDKGNGKYSFTMPGSKVTVKAVFTKEGTEVSTLPFTDVDANDWFYDAVKYAYDNKLMDGTSATTFAPNTSTSRAMVVTILWRMEGSPVVNYAMSFGDVASDTWYTEAVRWAASEGIVTGYTDTAFGPDDTVTREQLAAILYRYAQHKDYDVSAKGELNGFLDNTKVSDWAKDAMIWAVGADLMNGKNGSLLDPTGTATRAEVAQLLMNFSTTFSK